MKFLKHKANGKVRLVMRNEAGKLLANHVVLGALKESNATSFVWTAVGDMAEGVAQDVTMSLRFGKSPDAAAAFKRQFADAQTGGAETSAPAQDTGTAALRMHCPVPAFLVQPRFAADGWGGGGQQQPAHPQYANYWAPLTRKRHIPPHSAQPQHTKYWAPRTRKRHQQEHRPQRPTERIDPTQHAKGRPGDRPGPRKGATTRRNVTKGGGGALVAMWLLGIVMRTVLVVLTTLTTLYSPRQPSATLIGFPRPLGIRSCNLCNSQRSPTLSTPSSSM